jgi:hypothetical protein
MFCRRGFSELKRDTMKTSQEGTSMKRLLLVLGLVAVFSLAASAKKTPTTTYNFQFLTTNGDPYCDGMFLKNYGNPQTLVDGFHSDPICEVEQGFDAFNLPVNGFLIQVASKYQYGGGSGPVMFVSDFAAGDVCFASQSAPYPYHSTSNITCPAASLANLGTSLYLINTTTNTWTLWISGSGTGEYVVNYGTFDPLVGPQLKTTPSGLPSSQASQSRPNPLILRSQLQKSSSAR